MREVDDDYAPEKKAGGHTVLIIVCVVGGVFLAVVLVCGGLGYFFVRSVAQGVQSVMAQANEVMVAMAEPELFFQDIAAGQLDAAYGRTSKAYQARMKLDEFKKFVDANKALKNGAAPFPTATNITPGRCTYQFTLTNTDGTSTTATVQVVKEGEQWRVDVLTIP